MTDLTWNYLLACVLSVAASVAARAQTTIRVGAFPHITHAQAMVGKANGWFDKTMGPQQKWGLVSSTQIL